MKTKQNKFRIGQVWVRTFGNKVFYTVMNCNAGKAAYQDIKPTDCKACKIQMMLVANETEKGYCCKSNLDNPDIKKLTKAELILENY
jgi:hypothetical protein